MFKIGLAFAAACNPQAMEANNRFIVDAAHCQRAEDELYAMLLRQDAAFAARFQFKPMGNVLFKVARAAGIVASLLGIALTLAFLVLGSPSWAVPPDPWYLPVFSAGFVFFWFAHRLQPSLQSGIRAWGERTSERSCRRGAARCVRDARRLAPFDAHYEVKDSLVVYSREKDGRRIVWRRDLSKYRTRGLALRGTSVTAIFRRPGSFYPSVVILHDSSDWLTRVLQDTGINSSQIA